MIRQGGSYIVEKDGTRRQVAPPTPDHPRRNAPRDADGKALDREEAPAAGATRQPSPASPRPAPSPASDDRQEPIAAGRGKKE